jgi:hypothetical protein
METFKYNNSEKPRILTFRQLRSYPIAGRLQYIFQFGLFGARLRMKIVGPLYYRRQTHQYTFYAAIGTQPKKGALIMYQIKFNVAPTSYFLPTSLLGSIT